MNSLVTNPCTSPKTVASGPASHIRSGAGVYDSETIGLTRRIANGDWDAFSVYYDAFFDFMFTTAKNLIGRDESTCLDIVQDSMLKAFSSMPPIEAHSNLTGWTRAVVRSVAYDFLRKEMRRNQPAAIAEKEPVDSLLVDEHVETAARLQWIEEQVDDLEPDFQKLMSLRYRLGWTLEKIAQGFGLKTGAVDGRIRRVVDKLRQQANHDFELD